MYRLSWDSYDRRSVPAVVPDFDKKVDEYTSSNHGSGNLSGFPRLPIVVIIHCFYLECLPLIGEYLPRLNDYDLLINLACQEAMLDVKAWAASLPSNRSSRKRNVIIRIVENSGRDVKEFWNPSLGLARKYSFFLKLHTKRSVHSKRFNPFGRSRGSLWLSDILESLIPGNGQTELILQRLRQGVVGAVFPFPWEQYRYAGWSSSANFFHAQKLLDMLNIPRSFLLCPLQYPVGNMFWGSTKLLESWSHLIYHNCQWPQEPVNPDGSLLHAIERSAGFLYNAIGLQVAYCQSVAGMVTILCWARCQPVRMALPSPRHAYNDIEVCTINDCSPDVFSLATDEYGLLHCMQRFGISKSTALPGLSCIILLFKSACRRLQRLL
jgi:hypothetical protein